MSSKDFYTPPLRFATQNIGEVACSDGGVKRGSARRARGLKKQGKKGTPDNNNRTVNQPLRKDWNMVVNKKFIAKIHIYISPLITCRTHIPQT